MKKLLVLGVVGVFISMIAVMFAGTQDRGAGATNSTARGNRGH